MMRKRVLGIAMALCACTAWLGLQTQAAKPADGEQYVGSWAGSWEGGGSGKFDLTIEHGADGALTGGVAVGTDQGDYTAKFTSLSFAGNKMTAKYIYPPDEQGEVALTATFADAAADGAWALGAKGGGSEMAAGTWRVTRK